MSLKNRANFSSIIRFGLVFREETHQFIYVYLVTTMSIKLKYENVDINQPKEKHVNLQYIPASVDEATTANVDQFFNNYTTEVDGC